jgi:glyoxylase-like metal-dependent hydrolase (beta-lactamase superfamily II)
MRGSPFKGESRMERHYKIKPLIITKFNLRKGDWAPNVCWYIEGADRNILIDTSISAEHTKRYTTTKVEDVISFEDALSSIGLKPEDMDLIIHTHLHFDHCGNTSKCKNAKVIVQKAELDFAFAPHPVFSTTYDCGLIKDCNLVPIEGNQEILPGIDVISVPGHTPGTQAVSIQTTKGKAIISGFCASHETFYPPTPQLQWGKDHPGPVAAPGIFVDAFSAYEAVVKVKGLADILLPMHDVAIFDMKTIP